MSNYLTYKSIGSYIKKNVSNYDPDKIGIGYKSKRNKTPIHIIVDGKIKPIHIWYYKPDIDILIPKFEDYFNHGIWDEKFYYTVTEGHLTGLIFCVDPEKDKIWKKREKYGETWGIYTEVTRLKNVKSPTVQQIARPSNTKIIDFEEFVRRI